MTTKKNSQAPATGSPAANRELKETLKSAKEDPSVKQALKKETQPENLSDLSELHDTTEIGTSGGDQRASQAETERVDKAGK